MKRAVTLILLATIIIWFYFPSAPGAAPVVEKKLPLPPLMVDIVRRPATENNLPEERQKKPMQKEKRPAPLLRERFASSFKVAGIYPLLENIYAVAGRDYLPEFGASLQQIDGLVIFKSASELQRPDWANVIQDPEHNQLYPLSAVLKISAVDSYLRTEILRQGLEEHYYHPELKILYLQSGHNLLLEHYQRLSAQGYSVEMEILRGPHLAR